MPWCERRTLEQFFLPTLWELLLRWWTGEKVSCTFQAIFCYLSRSNGFSQLCGEKGQTKVTLGFSRGFADGFWNAKMPEP